MTHVTLFELIALFIGGILVYTLALTICQELTNYKK
jgi:hypothetical protein